MTDLHIVVLAAGKGTRMNSAVPKVLHTVGGQPLLEHVLRAAAPLRPTSTTIVVGHAAESVRASFSRRPELRFVVQEPQLGTAHALMQTEGLLGGASGTLLMLSGDVPLLSAESLSRLVEVHQAADAAMTVLSALVDRPDGYGRIVRSSGQVAKIVEERDASPDERTIREINAGVYVFALAPLFGALRAVASQNAQGEFYLTDLVAIYRQQRRVIGSLQLNDPKEITGINSRIDLAEVGGIVREKKNAALMAAGVTLVDPATAYIDADVEIGPDTVIHPNVYLEGRTRIGSGCEIHAGARIVDSEIGDRATILNYTIIRNSSVAPMAQLGPFAHLRPGSAVGESAHIGNFVELKKTAVGRGSKASHLTYLGDTTIGERVNVGAGTITCNYDGVQKHATIVGDGAFIGSDSQLVAPVRIGKDAYVAAGSTIVDDVPPGSLAITRGRQINIEGWVERKRAARVAAAAERGSDSAAPPGR